MRLIPNSIRRTARPLAARCRNSRRGTAIPARIAAASLLILLALAGAGSAQPRQQAAARSSPCAACSAAQDIAGRFEEHALRLEQQAAALASAAGRQSDPRTRRWPGPARQDSSATIWTSGTAALTQSDRAHRAAVTAQGVVEIALSARRAAAHCDAEDFCAPVRTPLKPDMSDCAAAPKLSSLQTASLLSRINETISALEADGRSCAAMACPEADCGARAALLEAAAFTHGILGAATGGLPQTAADNPEPGISAAIASAATGALREIRSLPAAILPGGLDPAAVQKVAARLAGFEVRLTPDAEAGEPRPEWRATAARLALAGLRDGLGRLSMAGAGATREQWQQFAGRIGKAVATLVRMDNARRDAQQYRAPAAPRAANQCGIADASLAAALSRLGNAFNDSAECSVRAGCDARDAIGRGAARAAALLMSPVLEPQLEVMRALEEEAAIPQSVSTGAAAGPSPAPSLRFDMRAYQQGEAISLTLDTNQNRCLADGGLIALLDDDAGRKPPLLPAFNDEVPASRRIVRFGEEPPGHPMMHAPPQGNYMLGIYASAALGGARLLSVPLRVTQGEPRQCLGWTGVWQTEFGRMVTIEHADGAVSGSYRKTPGVRPGFIVGENRNGRFEGLWISEIGTGGASLRLMGEGVFRGSWGLSPRRSNNGGRWSGICVAPGAETGPEEAG